MAKTLLGKELEKYLQEKVEGIFALEATIAVGAYEGTLTREDIEKLSKTLNNKTEALDDIEKQLDSSEKIVKGFDITIGVQEGIAFVPIVTPAGPQPSPAIPLLIREKTKEQSDDLKEVVKEQGKSAIKQALEGLKSARKTLNDVRDKVTNQEAT